LTSEFFRVILEKIVKFKRLKFSSGFTIVELLVTLTILAIIATAVIVAINPAEQMAKARDAKRKTTVVQLAKAVEAYRITQATIFKGSNGAYLTTAQIIGGAISGRWASYCVNPRQMKIQSVPPVRYAKLIEPCKGDATGTIKTTDENNITYTWFSESGFCYGVTDDGEKAIISTPLESDEEIRKCSNGKAFVVWTSSGKHGIYCDQTGTIPASTKYDIITPLPTEEAPITPRTIPTSSYLSPTPTTPFVHPTDIPSTCTVKTSPTTLNFLVGKTNIITAEVASGLNEATITKMRFGSYSTDIAMVSPDNDTTSTYSTTVAALTTGNTAIWASADLSDGRTCQSTGTTDTNTNVYMPPELLQTNGGDCTEGTQCQSGHCVGNVCCTSPFCLEAGICQTGGGSCTGGTCALVVNVPATQNTTGDCTGASLCSGLKKRLKNTCNGVGACENLDSALIDCAGTCASWCNNGNCVNTNTADYGTCDVVTNYRVASGGTGRCEAGVCKAEFRFTTAWAISQGGSGGGPGLAWDYYTFQATIHNYGTEAKAVTVGAGMPGDYPAPPTDKLYGAKNSPILKSGESWTYTFPSSEYPIGVCYGSDACRPRYIMMRIVPLGQTTGGPPYYDSISSSTDAVIVPTPAPFAPYYW
jgi:prepilin-type N-terminal cleavage/methylation domain-containing protein